MHKIHPQVDEYILQSQWSAELEILRAIMLDCGLTEAFKWGVPCYTFQDSNVILLGELKGCCTLSFVKGALLRDEKGILIKPGENSQSARYLRFTNQQEIIQLEPDIKAYVFEAIEAEKAGLKVALKSNDDLEFTPELLQRMAENPDLKAAFYALTPGRRRGYHLYFSDAKEPKTRLARIDKYTPRILNGKGFHDCVCGLSKKMPTCDGSHKYKNELTEL